MYLPARKKERENMYVPLLSTSPPVRAGALGTATTSQQQDRQQRFAASPERTHPYESNQQHQQLQSQTSQQQQPGGGSAPSRPAGGSRAGGAASSGGGSSGSTLQRRGVIAPGQPQPAGRQRDKFVPLPDEEGSGEERNQYASMPPISSFTNLPTPAIFEDLPFGAPLISTVLQQIAAQDETSKRGRITLYCVSESFDRKKLDELLKLTFPPGCVKSHPDVLYVEYSPGSQDQPGGDVFFFDYGVVACWGMIKAQEMTLVRGLARQCAVQPLPDKEMEIDEFQFNYSALEKPHVQNDTVTLHRRYAQSAKMKLAISYALAQSTKLSVYEKRVVDIVLETKNLPETLAENGTVDITTVDIAKLIGKVFLQKSAVNLLSSVLDTPEFFWHAPDSFQALYQRLSEYLELPARVELLNSRFSVLQEMLDMLRDHQNNHHSVRLEMIVIYLIVIEVVVGLMELLGLFGLVGNEGGGARR